MALPSLVTISDLAAWVEEEIAEDNQRAAALLGMTSRLVRRRTHRDWITDDDPVTLDEDTPTIDEEALEVAKDVVLRTAARVWTNPTSAVHTTEGPFSARWNEQVGEGLYLTATDDALLNSFNTTSTTPGVWALPTTRGDAGDTEFADTVYAPTMTPGEPIPFRAPE